MEHLIDPTELEQYQSSLPRSPWLGFDHDTSQEYPVVPFEQYPLVRGWTAAKIQALRQRYSPEDDNLTSTLAMLQSWLFFGVLEDAFQQHFSTASFLTTTPAAAAAAAAARTKATGEFNTDDDACGHSTSTYLTTKALRPFYRDWHLGFLDLPVERQQSLSASFARAVLGARDWALYLEVRLPLSEPRYRTTPLCVVYNAIIRNTILLTELLGKAVPQAYRDDAFINHQMDLDPGNEIKHRLKSNGWCPSSATMLITRYGHSVSMYASLLQPVEPPGVSHANKCTKVECKAYNVDVPTYEPRHVRDGCSCEYVLPPRGDVFKILESGAFPVLDGEAILKDADTGTLSAKRHEAGMKYVAISHVWSDGLGSTTEKGLPRCQVVQLVHLCAAISDSALFWIDALCVPKDPELRNTAIQLMASTYGHASTTLVLDYGLRHCASTTATVEELAIRILSSVWLRRLWTLKEGLLACNLVFLFRDAFLPMPHLLSRIFESAGGVGGFSGPIAAALMHELSGFNRNLYVKKPAHINHMQRLLCYRTSSRTDDETLAVAPLFHVDVAVVLPLRGEARMIAFLTALGTVPCGLVFSGASRLKTRGFRWAPRTFMHGRGLNDLGQSYGRVTDEGFIGDFRVLEFGFEDGRSFFMEHEEEKKKSSIYLRDVEGKRGYVLIRDDYKTDTDADDNDDEDRHEDSAGVTSSLCNPAPWDLILIRTQPSGEVLPGIAIVLTRERERKREQDADRSTRSKTKPEPGPEILTYTIVARALISVDHLADLRSVATVHFSEGQSSPSQSQSQPQSSDVVVAVRSCVQTIRLS